MLRTLAPQQSLWASVLPEVARGLPPALAELDKYLEDPALFEPFRPYFHPSKGRPSVPMETYARMMVLKYRYRLGFEALCEEVSDSISWRLFCKVPIGAAVPDASTLEKTTSRCGDAAVRQLNGALLEKAHREKLIKLDKARADTTVVPADVKYPSDAGLLAKGISRLVVLSRRLKAMGLAARTATRDRRRSVNVRTHAIGTWLRRRSDEAKEEVLAITAELAGIAEAALAEAAKVAANSARGLSRRGEEVPARARSTLAELKDVAATLEKVASQTRRRLGGDMPEGAERVVSFHDKDARPIRKGRIGVPVEFGYKAQLVDNSDGVVLDYDVVMGNPSDNGLLTPALRRIKTLFGSVPKAVAADRGYGGAETDAELEQLGVNKVAIPRKGKPSAARKKAESAPGFRKLVKWRTGCEGRVASLKRNYGWGRSLMDGTAGTSTWCGWGVFASNSIKISHLAASRQRATATAPGRPRQAPILLPGTAPPRTAPTPTGLTAC
jgi:transposase, IS5 family